MNRLFRKGNMCRLRLWPSIANSRITFVLYVKKDVIIHLLQRGENMEGRQSTLTEETQNSNNKNKVTRYLFELSNSIKLTR